MLHGTKEQEFAALNLALALCRWGLPTPAQCDACSTRPCFSPFRQIRAFEHSMIYSSIRSLRNGQRSKMCGERRTPLLCKGMAMRKSTFNAGIDNVNPTAAGHESVEKR